MGQETACRATVDGRGYTVTAHLDARELAIRGEFRMVMPLAAISGVEVRDGVLGLAFGGRRIEIVLGPAAAKWADRIRNPPSRLDRIGIRSGMRVALVGVEDAGLTSEIAARGATLAGGRATGLDVVMIGVSRPGDLDQLERLKGRIAPAGAIWVVRRKGPAAPVPEAASMAAGKRAGLVDVKVVSFSETHTAEKFVIPLAARSVGPAAAQATRKLPSSRSRR